MICAPATRCPSPLSCRTRRPQVFADEATSLCLKTNRPCEILSRNGAGWRVQGESAPPAPHAWREASPLRWPERSMVTLGPLEIKTFRIVTKPAPAVRVAAA